MRKFRCGRRAVSSRGEVCPEMKIPPAPRRRKFIYIFRYNTDTYRKNAAYKVSLAGLDFAEKMEESEMIDIDTLISYCGQPGGIRAYILALYAGMTDETITVVDLIQLIISLQEKENDRRILYDDLLYDEYDDILYDDCREFAFLLLKKGLLDRRWTYQDGVFSQSGRQVFTMDEIDRLHLVWDVNYLGRLKYFDPEGEAFRLAVLDHCTEENIVPAMFLAIQIDESCFSSLEDLEILNSNAREISTLQQLREKEYDTCNYVYVFDYDEMDYDAGDALDRLRKAETYEQVIYAALEAEYYVGAQSQIAVLAYLFFTGQKKDF